MIEQIKAAIISYGPMAVVAFLGVIALILAAKIAHLIARLLMTVIALAAIGGGAWWFFLRH